MDDKIKAVLHMTPIDKLDFILNSIEPYNGHFLTLTEITKQSEILGKININELPSIVNKLTKDGYLDFEINDSKDTIFGSDKMYMITFEGKMLNEQGGYRYKEKRDSISAKLQLAQTWAITVGTALAGLYGLSQVIITLKNAYS